MATTNIELDIENITGVSDADDQFVKTAQKWVVSSIPKDLMLWAGTSTAAGTHGGDSSPTEITLPQPTDNIIDVQRNGFSAEEVPESMQGFIANSSSLHLATETFPKYYLQAGNKVIVKPNPSDSETALVNYVDFLKIDDDCDLRGAVIFHACSSEFSKLASSNTGVTFTQSAPVYIPPIMEDRTVFSSYTSGLSETDPGTLTITAVSPQTPSLPSIGAGSVSPITIASLPSAPNYTAPAVTGDTQEITAANVAGSTGTAADRLNFQHWYDVLADFIEDEEDSELAAVQLQKINSYIGAYQAAIQNQLNIFNEGNAVYQAALQRNIQQSQIDMQDAQKEADLTLQAAIQDYTLELQKYGADVNKYQAEVNTQVSEYSQKLSHYQTELQTSLQAWQQESNEKVARYQAKVQDAINKFNEENAEYQAQLQVSIQNSNLKPNHYANESKKYYEWAVQEINMYIQNNSKIIGRTMAAQAAQQQRA